MYGSDGITREMLAGTIRRLHTPVCWTINHTIADEALERIARLGSAFLIHWKAWVSPKMKSLLTTIHHDYANHLIFIDAREAKKEDQNDVVSILEHVEVRGGVVPGSSELFLESAVETGRFIFVALDATIPPKALAGEIHGIVRTTRFNRQGRLNVGGAVGMQHAPLFSGLEQYASTFPLLITCTPRDWKNLPSAIQGAVTIAPGMRLIALPTQGCDGAWNDACIGVARQLADILQCAIAARAAIP